MNKNKALSKELRAINSQVQKGGIFGRRTPDFTTKNSIMPKTRRGLRKPHKKSDRFGFVALLQRIGNLLITVLTVIEKGKQYIPLGKIFISLLIGYFYHNDF